MLKGKNRANVRNVGELKEALRNLPDNLLIECGFTDSCDLVIFNLESIPVLSFTEGGDWVDGVDG